MSKRVQLSELKEEEEQDLKNLIENYIKKSEELEKRESKVFRQIELMQSAVASLQAWNQDRKTSAVSSESVRINVKEIEEETQKIKEETEKIQEEVKQKMEENKKLEDEIKRKKAQQSAKDESTARNFLKMADEEGNIKRAKSEKIEFRATKANASSAENSDPGIQFFNERMRKLKESEKKLKKESEQDSEEVRKKKKSLKEKIELLEWESQIDKQLIETLRKRLEEK